MANTNYTATLLSEPESIDWRRAGRDNLSLALISARNRTLQLLAAFEHQLGERLTVPRLAEVNPPLWELGHIAWFQEFWIGRNLQRHLGQQADPQAARLPSLQASADRWWNSSLVPHATRWDLDLPSLADTRNYLLATLESTLDMLTKAPDDDESLYFYRLCLLHEDMHAEAFVMLAQTLGLPLALSLPAPRPVRESLLVPSALWRFGSDAGQGFAFDNEMPAYEVAVPEFEIDAQPVNWAQFIEFIDDGGYDRPELWHPQAQVWLAQGHAEGRRAPRHVAQIGVARLGGEGAVIQHYFGQARRMAALQPAMHLSWWEADAWCRWAGRRLPTEVEWELAAHTAHRRGFHWGDVWEWTGSRFRGFAGFAPGPYRDYSAPWFETHRSVRGASLFTSARIRHPKYRNFYAPERDDVFIGFRSCAA
jgi:ergothioneine biosynthesis protein EgtB